jgi:D-serine ammonia-lyase
LLDHPAISIFGFYCHAGDSYASTTVEQASSFLTVEMQAVNSAATLALSMISQMDDKLQKANHQFPFVLSVGSTPTAHSTSFGGSPAAAIARELTGGELEIHAGNYPVCDLQQISTGLVEAKDVAHRVLTTVISYYPSRGEAGGDEAMCDAGGIAMSRDTGPSGGYGDVVPWVSASDGTAQQCEWRVGRCSQEHGVLVRRTKSPSGKGRSGERSSISLEGDGGPQLVPGEQLWIVGQHACLTCAAYPWYYILDSGVESGLTTVQDIWVPWKGW